MWRSAASALHDRRNPAARIATPKIAASIRGSGRNPITLITTAGAEASTATATKTTKRFTAPLSFFTPTKSA